MSAPGKPPAALDAELRAGVVVQVERLLDVGRADDARRTLARALAAQPDDVELLLLAARIEDAAGARAEARRLIAEVLSRAPHSFTGRVLHYVHLAQDERYADAERVILELLHERPQHAGLIVMYARLMLSALRLEKARALADEALRISPDDPDAQMLDALLHVVAGDDARASERVSELIARNPEAMAVARTAIAVFATGGRPKDALAIARSVLRAEPGDAEIVDLIVELRMQTHPLMLPYWPLQRWGWTASAVLWGVGVVGLRALSQVSEPAALAFAGVWLGYVVGSWLVPPWLRRRLQRVGA